MESERQAYPDHEAAWFHFKMYEFHTASITNYHQLCSLKQQKFTLPQFYKLESKIKVCARLVLSKGWEGESILHLSELLVCVTPILPSIFT
jgi:hypothetical protein